MDNDFGAWPNENLVFASPFGIVDALDSTSQDIHVYHYGDTERWWKDDRRGAHAVLQEAGRLSLDFQRLTALQRKGLPSGRRRLKG